MLDGQHQLRGADSNEQVFVSRKPFFKRGGKNLSPFGGIAIVWFRAQNPFLDFRHYVLGSDRPTLG